MSAAFWLTVVLVLIWQTAANDHIPSNICLGWIIEASTAINVSHALNSVMRDEIALYLVSNCSDHDCRIDKDPFYSTLNQSNYTAFSVYIDLILYDAPPNISRWLDLGQLSNEIESSWAEIYGTHMIYPTDASQLHYSTKCNLPSSTVFVSTSLQISTSFESTDDEEEEEEDTQTTEKITFANILRMVQIPLICAAISIPIFVCVCIMLHVRRRRKTRKHFHTGSKIEIIKYPPNTEVHQDNHVSASPRSPPSVQLPIDPDALQQGQSTNSKMSEIVHDSPDLPPTPMAARRANDTYIPIIRPTANATKLSIQSTSNMHTHDDNDQTVVDMPASLPRQRGDTEPKTQSQHQRHVQPQKRAKAVSISNLTESQQVMFSYPVSIQAPSTPESTGSSLYDGKQPQNASAFTMAAMITPDAEPQPPLHQASDSATDSDEMYKEFKEDNEEPNCVVDHRNRTSAPMHTNGLLVTETRANSVVDEEQVQEIEDKHPTNTGLGLQIKIGEKSPMPGSPDEEAAKYDDAFGQIEYAEKVPLYALRKMLTSATEDTQNLEMPDEKLRAVYHEQVRKWFDVKLKRLLDARHEYCTLFIENGFENMRVIQQMTNQDLVDIGINKLGHRKQILTQIQKLRK